MVKLDPDTVKVLAVEAVPIHDDIVLIDDELVKLIWGTDVVVKVPSDVVDVPFEFTANAI